MNALQKAYMKKLTDFKTELNAAYRKAERFYEHWANEIANADTEGYAASCVTISQWARQYFTTPMEAELCAAVIIMLEQLYKGEGAADFE